jgi:lactoylglutathione lyase
VRYLHTMIRVFDLDRSLKFYCDVLGFKLTRRNEHENGRFTLAFLQAPGGGDGELELTYNWDQKEPYDLGKGYGHMAFAVESFDEVGKQLQDNGLNWSWGPKGSMAFIEDPDGYEIELLIR